MIESTTNLKPNDVTVILRPSMDGDVWTGAFDVMVAGIGPVTLQPDEMQKMVGMGVLLASVVPLMETDREVAQTILTHCNEKYSELGEFDLEDEPDAVTTLTAGTRCAGGMQ